MNLRVIYPLIILLIVGFSGCTTTKITSKVLKPEVKNIDSIFYALYADESIEKAAPYFKENSFQAYLKNNVEFQFKLYTFLENGSTFSKKKVFEEASKEEMDYALMLASDDYDFNTSYNPGYWSNGMYMGGGSSKHINHGLKATLFSVSDSTEVWRAVIEISSGDYGNREQTGNSLAKKLIRQLIKDGILTSDFEI